ncbi:hypothetical protein E4U16_005213 [Claviceps sp. LM84 group G4]|nr:hypothetical protein E4U16_005213 [Claviceps sp. LM84 group G4]
MAGNNSSSEERVSTVYEVHATTTFAGKVVKDPMGLHLTVSFKTQEHLDRQRHVICHGYLKTQE